MKNEETITKCQYSEACRREGRKQDFVKSLPCLSPLTRLWRLTHVTQQLFSQPWKLEFESTTPSVTLPCTIRSVRLLYQRYLNLPHISLHHCRLLVILQCHQDGHLRELHRPNLPPSQYSSQLLNLLHGLEASQPNELPLQIAHLHPQPSVNGQR